MRNQLIAALLLACMYCSPIFGQEQTRYQRINTFERGAYLGFGAMTAQMLNSNYTRAVQRGDIKPQPGFMIDFQYAFAPLTLTITGFSSNFKIKKLEDYVPEKDILVRHTGAEIGLALSFLQLTQYFSPFIGGGFSFSDIGAPIAWGGLQDKESETPLHVKAIYAPTLKLGANINFGPSFGLRFEYRRTVLSKLAQVRQGFNQLSVSLNFHAPKD
jgi:hypothetical protein